MKKQQLTDEFKVLGLDIYPEFIERSIVNFQKYRPHIKNINKISVDF